MADSREEAGGLAEKDAEISVVEKQVTEETNDPAGATEQSSGTALPTEQDGVPEFTRPESGPLEEVTPGLGAAEQVPRPGPSAAERTSSGPAAAAEEAVVEPRAVVPRPGPAQGGAAGPRAAEGLGQEADAAGQGQVHGDFQETAQIQDVGPTAPATDTERQEGAQAGSEKPETRTGGPRLLDTLDSQRAQVPEGTATGMQLKCSMMSGKCHAPNETIQMQSILCINRPTSILYTTFVGDERHQEAAAYL